MFDQISKVDFLKATFHLDQRGYLHARCMVQGGTDIHGRFVRVQRVQSISGGSLLTQQGFASFFKRCLLPTPFSCMLLGLVGSVCQVIIGQVLTAGCGQNPARQSVLHAGLPETCPALTINKAQGGGRQEAGGEGGLGGGA